MTVLITNWDVAGSSLLLSLDQLSENEYEVSLFVLPEITLNVLKEVWTIHFMFPHTHVSSKHCTYHAAVYWPACLMCHRVNKTDNKWFKNNSIWKTMF